MVNGRSGSVSKVVATRRISFGFNAASPARRHFVADDIALSHLVALLSGFFPSGEEFFIHSVLRYRDQIDDPWLKLQVAGFIGQEMTHGLQHRALNDELVRMGYWATGGIDRLGAKLVNRFERQRDRLPSTIARFALACTVAVEHLTAVLGARVLDTPWIQRQLTDPEVRAMLNWHAIEEMEHKAVARTLHSIAALPRGPLFAGVLPLIRRYFAAGFHSDDIDDSELLERWRAHYFGGAGVLLDHLR